MGYAQNTSVPIERTKAEIERTLTKYGASKFFTGWDEDTAVVGFHMSSRFVQFRLPIPNENTLERKRRTVKQVEDAVAQAQRAAWRALLLVVKAKLESVESGIESFEEAFLAHIMVTDGKGGTTTVGEQMIPQIEGAYERGTPMLALNAGGAS